MNHTAYNALGSNLGDRLANIEAALAALRATRGITVNKVSDMIESAPVGPPGQGPYLNGAAMLATNLTPRDLLDRFLAIESALGRNRADSPRHGPRTIDIDLLLYGDRVINEPGLHVPHPCMHERGFVLAPLAQIAGQALHPVLNLTIQCLLTRLPSQPMEYVHRVTCSIP
jgi:2-amino-4-hydroxy-6-hydroxymethyldihydropteridine diphosphokinase